MRRLRLRAVGAIISCIIIMMMAGGGGPRKSEKERGMREECAVWRPAPLDIISHQPSRDGTI